MIAAAILTVFIYSIAIAPGLDNAAYADFANWVSPWVSIVVGGPVFFALGRLLVGKLGPSEGRRAGWIAWALYSTTDLVIVSTAGAWSGVVIAQWIVSQSIKLLAVALATRAS